MGTAYFLLFLLYSICSAVFKNTLPTVNYFHYSFSYVNSNKFSTISQQHMSFSRISIFRLLAIVTEKPFRISDRLQNFFYIEKSYKVTKFNELIPNLILQKLSIFAHCLIFERLHFQSENDYIYYNAYLINLSVLNKYCS